MNLHHLKDYCFTNSRIKSDRFGKKNGRDCYKRKSVQRPQVDGFTNQCVHACVGVRECCEVLTADEISLTGEGQKVMRQEQEEVREEETGPM